jgi:predicted kinase
MKELFLLRGLPGAGKSTLAKSLTGGSGSMHLEADMYFVNSRGEYKFDASQLKQAHAWCQNTVEYAMVHGKRNHFIKTSMQRIVVSNTFTQEWEMKAYVELAKKYGYQVTSIIVENRHGGVSEHNVPDEVLDKMKNRFEIKL